MDHVFFVAVINCRKYLFNYLSCVSLAKILFFCYFVKEFTTRAELGYQKEPFRILEKLIKFKDVGVIESFEDINFTNESITLLLGKMLFIYDFNCSQSFGFLM